eukprot:scaffold287245_cov30-Tisochrysis_lutea.AAC.3
MTPSRSSAPYRTEIMLVKFAREIGKVKGPGVAVPFRTAALSGLTSTPRRSACGKSPLRRSVALRAFPNDETRAAMRERARGCGRQGHREEAELAVERGAAATASAGGGRQKLNGSTSIAPTGERGRRLHGGSGETAASRGEREGGKGREKGRGRESVGRREDRERGGVEGEWEGGENHREKRDREREEGRRKRGRWEA